MKTILCYGDSNTWGYDPATKTRLGLTARWPGAMRVALGEGYWVVEEGLCGRTTVWDDPIEGDKSGKRYLPPCLATHKPIDLVVIMLGTNDLKTRFSLSAMEVAEGAGTLAAIVAKSECGPGGRAPRVLLISPPPFAEVSEYAEMFEQGREKSRKLARHFARVAKEMGCAFLDAGSVIRSSDLDGFHFDAPEHEKLGRAVAEVVRGLV